MLRVYIVPIFPDTKTPGPDVHDTGPSARGMYILITFFKTLYTFITLS
jgi:hypothetical protein